MPPADGAAHLAAPHRPVQRDRLDMFGIAALVALSLIWGVQQVASKTALEQGVAPMLQAVIRSAIAGPLLLLFLFARQGAAGLRQLVARDGSLRPGLITGLLFGIEFMLLFPGVQLTSASRAIILLFTGVFFTAIGAHIFIPADRMRGTQWLGLGVAFVGVVLTVGDRSGQGSLLGDLLVIGAAIGWSATAVMVKAVPALARLSSEKVLAYQLWGALPIQLVACLAFGQLAWPSQATPLAWASLAYQGVLVAFLSYLAFFWLLARYPAGHVAAFSFLSPLFGVLAAWAICGEPLTFGLLGGLACICVGLRLVNR